MPKRRAASRWLSPSTWQAWRTLPYSSTENIPRLPARSDRAQGRHQGGTVWHRRGRDTQPAVSEGHFLTAAYTNGFPVEKVRISYELGKAKVIPDGWLLIQSLETGKRYPLLLEI